MEKKKFKKLSLKKESLINLNDQQMKNIQGGAVTSTPCAITASISITYGIGKEISAWTCTPTPPPPTPPPGCCAGCKCGCKDKTCACGDDPI